MYWQKRLWTVVASETIVVHPWRSLVSLRQCATYKTQWNIHLTLATWWRCWDTVLSVFAFFQWLFLLNEWVEVRLHKWSIQTERIYLCVHDPISRRTKSQVLSVFSLLQVDRHRENVHGRKQCRQSASGMLDETLFCSISSLLLTKALNQLTNKSRKMLEEPIIQRWRWRSVNDRMLLISLSSTSAENQ